MSDFLPNPDPRLFEVLSKEMSEYVLRGNARTEAKARLGNRGELPLNQYELKFASAFDSLAEIGTRRSHVESAIRTPDRVEHLLPERFDFGMDFGITFVAKYEKASRRENNFWLLVQTQRVKAALNVTAAWRVYLSDVKLKSDPSPLDILRAFVDVYGLDLPGIGVSPKFVLYKVIPASLSDDPKLLFRLHPEDAKRKFLGVFALRASSLGVVEVACAYAIDLEKYKYDLARHGVSVGR